jgi:hypothetical protein
LDISFNFAPVAGRYVIAAVTGGATVSGAYSDVFISFIGFNRGTVGCVTTSDPINDGTSISVDVTLDNCESAGMPMWIFIAAGVGGALLIVAAIILVVCLVRRRNRLGGKGDDYSSAYNTPLTSFEPSNYQQPRKETTYQTSFLSDEFEVPEQGTLMTFN